MCCTCSCDAVDSVRVSITSTDGERRDIGVYCLDKRPPLLMSGAPASLHVTLTSRSPLAAAASTATPSGFRANFGFVTGRPTYPLNHISLFRFFLCTKSTRLFSCGNWVIYYNSHTVLISWILRIKMSISPQQQPVRCCSRLCLWLCSFARL